MGLWDNMAWRALDGPTMGVGATHTEGRRLYMVRWGILGAGNIAHRFAVSLRAADGGELVAISCRSAAKAAAFAEEFGVSAERAYSDEALGAGASGAGGSNANGPVAGGSNADAAGMAHAGATGAGAVGAAADGACSNTAGVARAGAAHEALLADDGVDAIYLCLPHSMHREWAIAALRAGKAVLCEKPACLSAEELAEVVAVSRETGVPFMEGMKTRFVPCYQAVREAVCAGEIGEVTGVRASLCNDMRELFSRGTTYHSDPMLAGGGVLLDCGTYCASWIEDFLPKAAPHVERFCGAAALPADLDSGFAATFAPASQRVDVYCDARLSLDGAAAELECAFDRAKPRQAVIEGTHGRIVVDELHRPQHAMVFPDGGEVRELDCPYEVDDFHGEICHFQELLESGRAESPVMTLEASLRVAVILDAARACFLPDAQSVNVLECQERLLRYGKSFTSDDAFVLGCVAVHFSRECDLPLAVRIVRESDGLALFQWMGEGKAERHVNFMEGKRRASLECGHSSLWAELDPERRDERGLPSVTAGAFPIRVGDEVVATISTSGSHLGLDHEVCVRALASALGLAYGGDGSDGRVPAFRGLVA